MPPSRSAKLAPSTSKTELHNSVVVEDFSKDSCEYGAGLSLLYHLVNRTYPEKRCDERLLQSWEKTAISTRT
jgi:hypothetical protein